MPSTLGLFRYIGDALSNIAVAFGTGKHVLANFTRGCGLFLNSLSHSGLIIIDLFDDSADLSNDIASVTRDDE